MFCIVVTYGLTTSNQLKKILSLEKQNIRIAIGTLFNKIKRYKTTNATDHQIILYTLAN